MAWGLTVVLGTLATPLHAQLVLPPGFTAEVYVTGVGFDSGGDRGARGIPSVSSIRVDSGGAVYLARTGARFRSGEVEDLFSVYRVPPGGARLTPQTEGRALLGPPLRNPHVGALGPRGELLVTTYDRDRRLGAVYRVIGGRPVLFAGGTPPRGSAPLLSHPEGIALDREGRIYVADYDAGAVVRLAADGSVLDPRWARVTRPRLLAVDETGHLWVGADGSAESPVQAGAGEIWRIAPDGQATRVLQGPLPGGLAPSPAGTLFVAQRRTGQVFALTPAGRRLDFATAGSDGFVRGLAFAPVTAETRAGGLAGDLFVIVAARSNWQLNEVVRVSGPFGEWLRRSLDSPDR